jgi:hypothetical protein
LPLLLSEADFVVDYFTGNAIDFFIFVVKAFTQCPLVALGNVIRK